MTMKFIIMPTVQQDVKKYKKKSISKALDGLVGFIFVF